MGKGGGGWEGDTLRNAGGGSLRGGGGNPFSNHFFTPLYTTSVAGGPEAEKMSVKKFALKQGCGQCFGSGFRGLLDPDSKSGSGSWGLKYFKC